MQSFNGGWATAAKLCCFCNSTAATLFCRTHSAFLCLPCDSHIHAGASHPRVSLCDVCQHSPAAVACNADAAALCLSCDSDIHSVNPLARRHLRTAVEPFFDSVDFIKPPSVFKFLLSNDDLKSEDIFFEMDSLIDFGDGIVPDHSQPATDHSTGDFSGLEFCSRSKLEPLTSYTSQSLSQSVSSGSFDVGVVPERTTGSEEPVPAVVSTDEKARELRGMDREARVMRYREKKKNRKFEKTIRYASRKAYAEIRPRVKGRFVKRTEVDSQIDRIFGDDLYGVVPSI